MDFSYVNHRAQFTLPSSSYFIFAQDLKLYVKESYRVFMYFYIKYVIFRMFLYAYSKINIKNFKEQFKNNSPLLSIILTF